jgi:hypothetical protein
MSFLLHQIGTGRWTDPLCLGGLGKRRIGGKTLHNTELCVRLCDKVSICAEKGEGRLHCLQCSKHHQLDISIIFTQTSQEGQ